jgi:superfamily II DNA/RNA helicase
LLIDEAYAGPLRDWLDNLRPGSLLIFTEYDDTKRYLVELLRAAIANTGLAEHRIEVFHGPTPPDKREAIKRAFNLSPSEHPVRILVATDAAREGLNLQAHCWNVFHFDLPWNPSRLEQRNGREQTIPEPVERRLRAAMAPDIEELLPHLGQRGQNAKADAEKRLAERGHAESQSMLRILEEQKKRVAEQAGRAAQLQLDLFNDQEKRQFESNRRYWQRWLKNVEGDIQREPARFMDFYTVASFRIEPIGLAYLWPVTG